MCIRDRSVYARVIFRLGATHPTLIRICSVYGQSVLLSCGFAVLSALLCCRCPLVSFGMGLGLRGAPVAFPVRILHPRLCKIWDGVGAGGMRAMVCNRAGLVRFTS